MTARTHTSLSSAHLLVLERALCARTQRCALDNGARHFLSPAFSLHAVHTVLHGRHHPVRCSTCCGGVQNVISVICIGVLNRNCATDDVIMCVSFFFHIIQGYG